MGKQILHKTLIALSSIAVEHLGNKYFGGRALSNGRVGWCNLYHLCETKRGENLV